METRALPLPYATAATAHTPRLHDTARHRSCTSQCGSGHCHWARAPVCLKLPPPPLNKLQGQPPPSRHALGGRIHAQTTYRSSKTWDLATAMAMPHRQRHCCSHRMKRTLPLPSSRCQASRRTKPPGTGRLHCHLRPTCSLQR